MTLKPKYLTKLVKYLEKLSKLFIKSYPTFYNIKQSVNVNNKKFKINSFEIKT